MSEEDTGSTAEQDIPACLLLLAEVRVCSGGDKRLSSLCKLFERGERLAYRVTGTDRVHPFGLIWYVNN